MSQQAHSKAIGESFSVLVFELQESRYAVDAARVLEILWLPELTPVEEAPDYVAGVFVLRGEIIPVVDLDHRFGHRAARYMVSDNMVVLEGRKRRFGIIVNQVLSVEENAVLVTYGEYGGPRAHSLLAGEVEVDEHIVMLLDHERIMMAEDAPRGDDTGHPTFCPEATAEELDTFRQRAAALRGTQDVAELGAQSAFAVAKMNGEYYGVALDLVKEFAIVRDVAPVPCTPPHILGNINLRGDIVTLVDIRGLLDIPAAELERTERVIVVEHENMLLGVPTDSVDDVVFVQSEQLEALPEAISREEEEFLRGEVPYRERMMTVLNLERILSSGRLMVDETV
ncbi:MAG: chemotaxis protein CheW [Candidatus Sedimenticola endophacoides]